MTTSVCSCRYGVLCCFQALLCYLPSQTVPYDQILPNGLYDKLLLTINGRINPNAKMSVLSDSTKRISSALCYLCRDKVLQLFGSINVVFCVRCSFSVLG